MVTVLILVLVAVVATWLTPLPENTAADELPGEDNSVGTNVALLSNNFLQANAIVN